MSARAASSQTPRATAAAVVPRAAAAAGSNYAVWRDVLRHFEDVALTTRVSGPST